LRFKLATSLASGAALVVGGVTMYIAWDHNPQCDTHCDGSVDWPHWLLIGASWAIPTFLLVAAATYLLGAIAPKS